MISGARDGAVYTDLQGLAELRGKAKGESPEALRAAAKQFEALFLQMMLKSMRDTVQEDGLFSNDQTALYQEMYDKQVSLDISQAPGGVGLADMLVRQLQGAVGGGQRQGGAEAPVMPAPARMMEVLPVQRPAASPQPALTAVDGASRATPAPSGDPAAFDSPDQFVQALWPKAERAARRLGVDPAALVAQAALETGWGKAVIKRPDGSSSYNLFNIKADHRWEGDRVMKSTIEYRDGVAQQERAPFRAYGSFDESFDDYVSFLQANPRYRDALANAADPKSFIAGLQEAGYATDPRYSQKIASIMGRLNNS